MENMAKGCGRSDNIEGVERRPRIVIPTVESKVDSLTTTTYTSTVYSTTYTFAVAVNTIDSINRYNFFTINAFISTFSQILIHNHWLKTNLKPKLYVILSDGLLHNRGLHRSTCQFERLCLNHHYNEDFQQERRISK